ncbi:MAG: hypothetical protein ACP5NQ_09175 [Vulcanisaeta sp.]
MKNKKLEDRIKSLIAKYMDVDRYGGKILLIRENDVKEFPDLNSARRAALSMPGISIIIQVPSKDEVDDGFRRFLRINNL